MTQGRYEGKGTKKRENIEGVNDREYEEKEIQHEMKKRKIRKGSCYEE